MNTITTTTTISIPAYREKEFLDLLKNMNPEDDIEFMFGGIG